MAGNFVDKFIHFNRFEESPTSYFKWSGYTLLAAILRDNVFIDLPRKSKIYPNLYSIILSTRSSITRKASAMRAALKIIKHVDNTKIIQGTSSVPGIIKTISEDYTTKSGNSIGGAAFLLYSEEFTSALHIDVRSLDILTDWYDGHEDWAQSMAISGIHKIERICPTILGASNEENIREIYGTRAQKGGLLARTCLVREEKRRFMKSIFDKEINKEESSKEWSELLRLARDISMLRGEIHIDEDAIEEYNKWYFSITDEKISETGIEARIPTQALKLCMILAAAEKIKEIRRYHMEHAIDEVIGILKNYKIFVQSTLGTTPAGRMGALVLRELYNSKNEGLTRSQLIRVLLSDLDPDSLDKVLSTYLEADILELGRNKQGMGVYKMTQEWYEKLFIKFEGSKNDN